MLIMALDGNSLAYRAFYALPDDMSNASGQITNAVYGFTTMLMSLIRDHKPDGIIVVFDRAEKTFRHDAIPEYKAQREKAPDILFQQLGMIRELLDVLGVTWREQVGFEGDDLIATMAEKDAVEMTDLEEARDKVRFGRANKSRKIEEEERIATAYHEAGHAVLQVLLKDADPLHKVTIIPRGQAMGATFSLPEKDRYGYSRRHLLATMRVLCGGRIAEQRKTDDISSGASMDIKMATSYARTMVLQWGMSDRLGFVNYAGSDEREMFIPEKDYSPETARVIDEEVRRFIDSAYADATQMVNDHWTQIMAVAEALLSVETLSKDDVDRIMRGEVFKRPSVSELLQREMPKTPSQIPTTKNDPTEELPPGAMPSPI